MSPSIVPGTRPKISLSDVAKIIEMFGQSEQVCLLGLRGYYKDSMGKPGVNDRGIYDDAIVLSAPGRIVTFNANTDPAGFRKGIASLLPGIYSYRLGIHGLSKPPEKRYKALVQAAPVHVMRDDFDSFETGMFGINIHKGGFNSVSSIGCQTVYPSQWPEFITGVETQLKAAKQERVCYILREV